MCPSCNQSRAELMCILGNTQWVRCLNCGLEFTGKEWEDGSISHDTKALLPAQPYTFKLKEQND